MAHALRPRDTPQQYLLAALACAVITAGASLLPPAIDATNIVMIFLLLVLLVAVRFGRGPAVFAAFMSVALFDFFLVPPHLSFAVADVQYLITFAVMLVVALTASHLAADLRQQAEQASQRERRTWLLYELARELAGSLTRDQAAAALHDFMDGVGMQAALLLPDEAEALQVLAVPGVAVPRMDNALARTAYRESQLVELDHLAVFGEAVAYFPLKAPMRTRGVLAIATPREGIGGLHDSRTLLMTAASLVAIAIERLHYVEIAHATQVQMLSERLRSSILSSLSHDIRTPLAALVGMADSLTLTEPPLPAAARDTAEAIRDQATRLNGLVENLLDMARLNAGKVTLRREWCLIEDVIGSSLKLLRNALAQHVVTVTLAPDLPLLEFDAVLIERVLGNLLENAAKFAPPGTVIDISAGRSDGCVAVAVCDRGPGLPARREDLFTMFVRGETESAVPGMGLGLAICKAIIDAHHGRIEAADRDGGGACLRFFLPAGTPPTLEDEGIILTRGDRT